MFILDEFSFANCYCRNAHDQFFCFVNCNSRNPSNAFLFIMHIVIVGLFMIKLKKKKIVIVKCSFVHDLFFPTNYDCINPQGGPK